MPIYEIRCLECGRSGEVLVMNSRKAMVCPECGSGRTEKLMSAPSSLTGKEGVRYPGAGDTACCGSSPSRAGCSGPGSCCGKN